MIQDDTAKMLSEQLAAQLDACAVRFFKAPGWVVKNKLLFKWYAKLYSCKIEIKNKELGQTIYKFFKKGEKVGEMAIGQFRVDRQGDNPFMPQVKQAFEEFMGSRGIFDVEPLTGWPMEASPEMRRKLSEQAWLDFQYFLRKHL